jgi:hypothetical protein
MPHFQKGISMILGGSKCNIPISSSQVILDMTIKFRFNIDSNKVIFLEQTK